MYYQKKDRSNFNGNVHGHGHGHYHANNQCNGNVHGHGHKTMRRTPFSVTFGNINLNGD
jgi:hypothetical protein